MHLKVGLSRKSGQTKAEFGVDPQTKLTKVTSEILSEGEQRALALAGFLTEVALTEGSGPIIVDDPVSSLDRDRSVRVAERLAEEACQRQVIVFTHDIIFKAYPFDYGNAICCVNCPSQDPRQNPCRRCRAAAQTVPECGDSGGVRTCAPARRRSPGGMFDAQARPSAKSR